MLVWRAIFGVGFAYDLREYECIVPGAPVPAVSSHSP